MSEPKVKKLAPAVAGATVAGEPDRAWVQVTRKVSLGKFDMLEIGVGASVSLQPDETLVAAIRRASSDVRDEHADILSALREDTGV